MLDLEDALMILGFDGSMISLKMYDSLITFLMIWEVMGRLVLNRAYGRLRIFKMTWTWEDEDY